VLVIGAGSIGLTVMYWARRFGCRHIVAAARSERNAELARAMGASGFIMQGGALADRAAEALGGSADIVFECAGAAGLIGQAVDCVRFGGTVVSAGLCFDPEPFVSGKALMKQARILFSLAYGMDDFREAVDALDAGFVEPRAMLGETIALASLPGRLEELRHERSTCKVMVNPWG
jgi:(R,R)-butanediol dehydrogenase/meso-butanediol dehydrogenase/diacetyl reductase